jgi:hypothetical protein
MSQRHGNAQSIGRLIARELRQTHLTCMEPGCGNRVPKGEAFCIAHRKTAP